MFKSLRDVHDDEMMCNVQDLDLYLKGQGHI